MSFFDLKEFNGQHFCYMHGDNIRMYQCVDKDTECLTLEGWKKYNSLKIGELILTYNMKTDTLEYQPLKNKFIYDYDGKMLKIKTRDLDMMVTPNHRCVVDSWHQIWSKKLNKRIGGYFKREIKFAKELDSQDTIVARCKNFKNINEIKDWTDDEIKLLGWILTEGSFNKKSKRWKSCKITQSHKIHPQYVEEIEQIIKNLDIPYTKIVGIKGGKKSRQNSKSIKESWRTDFYFKLPQKIKLNKTKPFPRWILRFPQRQLKILINTMMKGDGSRNKQKLKNGYILSSYFSQKSAKSIEIIQELLFLCGIRGNKWRSCNGQNNIQICQKNKVRYHYKNNQKTFINYKGKIWCPETDNGTWIARRNGRIFITGSEQLVVSHNF